MSTELVGRDAELSSIGQFVSGVSGGAVALVLEGEAGIGKTTLWRAAIAMAEERDLLVLQAQPVESEATLSFAGVGDLLDPVLDTVLDPLPAAQRRALERALVLGEDEGAPLDPRAVRVALMNALRLLADAQPVVLAIDDSQWLDHASSAGLAYGIRRYRAERIGLLLSRRSGLESLLLDELSRDRELSSPPVVILALGRDKDASAILKELRGRADRLLCTTVASGPLVVAETLAEEARAQGLVAETAPDPARALARGLDLTRDSGWLLVVGSFYLAGAVRERTSPDPHAERS